MHSCEFEIFDNADIFSDLLSYCATFSRTVNPCDNQLF